MQKQRITPAILKSGYTKSPNSLIESLYSSKLTGREIKVLLFILRQSLGWQKNRVTLTRQVISDQTDIHISHISQITSRLRENGFLNVKRLKDGSDYALNYKSPERALEAPEINKNMPKNKANKVNSKSLRLRQNSVAQTRYNGVISSESKAEQKPSSEALKENFKEKTLYRSKLISEYFDNLQSQEKKWREKSSYKNLLKSGFPETEIEEGLRIITKLGIPGRRGEKPHSPMSWLVFGIDGLILTIRKNLKI